MHESSQADQKKERNCCRQIVSIKQAGHVCADSVEIALCREYAAGLVGLLWANVRQVWQWAPMRGVFCIPTQ